MCASRLLTGILLGLLAVMNVPNRPVDVSQILPPQFSTSRLAAWGMNYFPHPPWNATITEQKNTIYGGWTNDECCAVAGYYLDYGSAGLSFERVLKTVDNKWIAIKAANYTPWRLLETCIANNTLIVNILGQSGGQSHLLRYWYWADWEAFKEVTLVYPSSNASDMESMADQLMGEAARCSPDIF